MPGDGILAMNARSLMVARLRCCFGRVRDCCFVYSDAVQMTIEYSAMAIVWVSNGALPSQD